VGERGKKYRIPQATHSASPTVVGGTTGTLGDSDIFNEGIGDEPGQVNLFIAKVTDIKTGKRLPEYEDM